MGNRKFFALDEIFRFFRAGAYRSLEASKSRSVLANPLQKNFAALQKGFQRNFNVKSRVFSNSRDFPIFVRRGTPESEGLKIAPCPCKFASKEFSGAAEAIPQGFQWEIAAFQHPARFSDFCALGHAGVWGPQNPVVSLQIVFI